MEHEDIFRRNEEDANRYVAFCMRVAAVVAALMWGLNLLGFFIIDPLLMNLVMPAGILLFLLATPLVRVWRLPYRYLKYACMGCFLLGVGILAGALTTQLVLAWACPIILSCHYYSPRFTRFTLLGVLVCMLLSVYLGLILGVWDSNMMLSNEEVNGAAIRLDYMRQAIAAGNNIPVRVFNFYYLPRAVVLVVIYLIGLTLCRRTHGLLRQQEADSREKERIGAELNVATQIQHSMLPSIFPAFPERPEFDIYASMTPAKEVGGDFYDFFLVDDDYLALVIADVSGKGVPAALFMVTAKTLLKNAAQGGLTPAQVLKQVNGQLLENNEAEMFVTVWLGIYEIPTGKLIAANAGHEYPALRRGDGHFELYKDRHGFVLAGLESARYQEYELELAVGDTLFLYTDGVTEATDAHNTLYGTDRMLTALNARPEGNPRSLLAEVKGDIDRFVGEAPQFDDITMLCLKRRQ